MPYASPKRTLRFILNYSSPLGMAVSAVLKFHKNRSAPLTKDVYCLSHAVLLSSYSSSSRQLEGSTSPKRRKLVLEKILY
jgi:hypothetical protein